MNQRKIAVPDLAFAAAGLLALIATFLPWWSLSASATIGGQTESESVTVNAWNAASRAGDLNRTITGPLAWIPMLLLLLLGALALIRAFAAPQLLPGKVFYQAGAGVGALAVVLVLTRWVTYFKTPSSTDVGGVTASASSGASFGTYLGLLFGLAAAGAGVWALTQPHLIAAQAGDGAAQAGRGDGGGYPQPPYAQQPYTQTTQPAPVAQSPAPGYGQQAPYTPPQQAYPQPQNPPMPAQPPQGYSPPAPQYGPPAQPGSPAAPQQGQQPPAWQ